MNRKNTLIEEIKRKLFPREELPIMIFYENPQNSKLFQCSEMPGKWMTKKECEDIRASVHVFVCRETTGLALASSPKDTTEAKSLDQNTYYVKGNG